MRVLLGSSILVNIPYSFCYTFSIFNGLRMYIASPPRMLLCLLDSTNVKPSSFGGAAPSAIHVFWRHNISRSSCSSSNNTFR